jgi:TonB family protein
MKQTVTITLTALIFLAGCGVSRQTEEMPEQLEFITLTQLPPLTLDKNLFGLKMNLLLHVKQDGTIDNARMMGSSGDPVWDSLALQSVRQWRCAPPLRDGVPAEVWARQLVIVQVQTPMLMTIGQLTVPTREAADSLYGLVSKGVEFDHLFVPDLKTIDVNIYPGRVREQLKRLKENETTPPLRLGSQYLIFKRFHMQKTYFPPD